MNPYPKKLRHFPNSSVVRRQEKNGCGTKEITDSAVTKAKQKALQKVTAQGYGI